MDLMKLFAFFCTLAPMRGIQKAKYYPAIEAACERGRPSIVEMLMDHDNGLLEIINNHGKTHSDIVNRRLRAYHLPHIWRQDAGEISTLCGGN